MRTCAQELHELLRTAPEGSVTKTAMPPETQMPTVSRAQLPLAFTRAPEPAPAPGAVGGTAGSSAGAVASGGPVQVPPLFPQQSRTVIRRDSGRDDRDWDRDDRDKRAVDDGPRGGGGGVAPPSQQNARGQYFDDEYDAQSDEEIDPRTYTTGR